MILNNFDYYIIVTNIISFILYISNIISHKKIKFVKGILTLTTILGGAAGALFCLLLFDRKIVKDDLMMRVTILCMFIIQLILILVERDDMVSYLPFTFYQLLLNHRWLLYYLGAINLITIILFAYDKCAALKQQSRVSNAVLLGCAFVGGTAGAWLGIYLFRHKIKKNYYTVGIPLIFITHVWVLFYLTNRWY